MLWLEVGICHSLTTSLKVISQCRSNALQVSRFVDSATPMEMFLDGERGHICKINIHTEFLFFFLLFFFYRCSSTVFCLFPPPLPTTLSFFIVLVIRARLESHLEYKFVRILSWPMTNPNKTNRSKKEFLVIGVDKIWRNKWRKLRNSKDFMAWNQRFHAARKKLGKLLDEWNGKQRHIVKGLSNLQPGNKTARSYLP